MDRPSGFAVVGGVLAGFVAWFFTLIGVTMFLEATGVQVGDGPIVVLGLALPLLAGAVLLLVPSWRRAGVGFVMGLAIGSIVFAGACSWFLTSLGQLG